MRLELNTQLLIIILGDEIKNYETGEACSTHGREENWIYFLNGKFWKKKDRLKGLDADEMITIQYKKMFENVTLLAF